MSTGSLWLACASAILAAAAFPASVQQPVYIYLYSHIDDHVHLQISEERLKRLFASVEKYRSRNPNYGASATIQFSGAMARALVDRNPQTDLLETVKQLSRLGAIEIGYRGADEPTQTSRPILAYRGSKTSREWWLARSRAAANFLGEHKNRLTGAPQASESGGLREVLKIFGTIASASELNPLVGQDTEFVHQIRRSNLSPVMFGLPEPNPALGLHGYRDAAMTFSSLMSPEPNSSPELFWQDNLLRSSETSARSVRVIHAYEGPEAMRKLLEGLDRSKTRIIHVELGCQEIYLQPDFAKGFLFPPVRYSYDHPDRPALPGEALRSRPEVDTDYSKEDASIQWLVERFFPANPGSRFISNAELQEMASAGETRRFSTRDLKSAAADLLHRWGSDTFPPNYARIGKQYISLAEAFQLFATALGDLYRFNQLPDSVNLSNVYGPDEMSEDCGPNEGHVSAAAVTRESAALSNQLNDVNWKLEPSNMIPSWITVDHIRVNAAQFLRLMAQALLAPKSDSLELRSSHMFSPVGEMFPRNGSRSDQGATWTLKPAVLRPPADR